uniref:Uncharacterized SAM-binding protein YcdF, DUF218 family n=1 Tax=Candidatus Kentrum sp. UNK TaxID=2126344 RepID=A0A451A8H1_9GAMM|nr:MAG: Uncharacterized SAM-binding protein YcdF, DUF218 family [Candidatus Kentron sp. UNK]VFK70420.1 MAG: Uncharacterized SAM-binding protein YcdF, DUF218 family [Candidatus Kentron sp. UNK]
MLELYITKILPLFVYPLGLALLFCLLALFLGIFRKSHWLAWLFVCIGSAQLWLSATPLVSNYVLASLERRHAPRYVADYPTVQAIVVLGGGLEAVKPPRRTFEVNAEGDRVVHAARLYHAGKAPLILVSGGTLPWRKVPPETEAMRAFLEELGVPARAVVSEPASINTHENALFSKQILDKKGIHEILLVTSAFHMMRSAAVFRKVGFKVTPAPTDYRVVEDSISLFDFLPDVRYLHQTTIGLKEYMGLMYYALQKRL